MNRVIKIVVFTICMFIVIHDVVKIMTHLTSSYGWSALGFITFILSLIIAGDMYEQIKSVNNVKVKHTN